MSLPPDNAQQRQAFEADARKQRADEDQAEDKRLDAERFQGKERRRIKHEALVAACRAHEVALQVGLAKEVAAVIPPPCKVFTEAGPNRRGAVRCIAEGWRLLHQRSLDELGGPLHPLHLAFAIAEPYGLAVACASADFWRFDGLHQAPGPVEAAVRSILANDPIPLIEERLAAAELGVTSQCSAAHPAPHDGARLDGLRSRCTLGAMLAAADRAAAEAAAAVPPVRGRVVTFPAPSGMHGRAFVQDDDADTAE